MPTSRPQRYLLLGLLALGSVTTAAADAVRVPGGTRAIDRLWDLGDHDPVRFIAHLNRKLLAESDFERDPASDPARRLLRVHLAAIDELRALGTPFALTAQAAPGSAAADRLRSVAGTLGFEVRLDGTRPTLVPRAGVDAADRRRVGYALGLPLLALVTGDVGAVQVSLDDEMVPAPFGLATWSAAVGRPIDRDSALEALLDDPRLGLIVAGLGRLDRDARDALDERTLQFLYAEAALLFEQVAPAIEVRDDRIVLPGGALTDDDWSLVTGVGADQPARFVRGLFGADGGRAARLFFALRFAPDDTARPLVRPLLTPTGRGGLRLLPGGRRGRGRGRPDPALRAHGLGPAWLGRAVAPLLLGSSASDPADGDPVDGDRRATTLAIGATYPGQSGRLAPTGDVDHRFTAAFAAALDSRPRPRQQAILLRTLASLRTSPELRTEALAARLAAQGPPNPLVPSLLTVAPLSATTVNNYLDAVAAIDALPRVAVSELAAQCFQGGLALLDTCARTGALSPAHLDSALEEWSQLFRWPPEPATLVTATTAWLDRLLGVLPPVAAGPGRGPRERVLLRAMVGFRDPQGFRYQGLDYRERRGHAASAAMAARLEQQGIPSIDALLDLLAKLQDLEAGGASQRANAEAIASALAALPPVGPGPGNELSADRNQQLALGQALVAAARSGSSIPPATVRSVRAALLPDVRLVLVATAYANAFGDGATAGTAAGNGNRGDNPLLADPNLVRSHRLWRASGAAIDDASDRPAALHRDGQDAAVFLLGNLLTVEHGLLPFRLRGAGYGAAGIDRQQLVWRRHQPSVAWMALDPAAFRLAAALVAAGRQIEATARDGQADDHSLALAFVTARLPRARLEATTDASRVSPSDHLALGLAALVGDRFGPAAPQLIRDQAAAIAAARDAQGDDWRRQLDRIGPAMPHATGSFRPQVGTWPPYEALEHEWPHVSLFERELADVTVQIADHLGRRSLPGALGADLLQRLLDAATVQPLNDGPRDWEGHLRWIATLDDTWFEEEWTACLRAGLYTVE